MLREPTPSTLVPAKAGTHRETHSTSQNETASRWIPACAGMSGGEAFAECQPTLEPLSHEERGDKTRTGACLSHTGTGA
jgi:hypothetical protein